MQRNTEGQQKKNSTCPLILSGVATRTLGSGCDTPPTQAARARPLSRAPKEALLLCAGGRGRSLGRGYLLHVLGLLVFALVCGVSAP